MPLAPADPPVLLLPGLGNSGPDHWQSHWQRLFGLPRVEQQDWNAPRYPAWEAALAAAVRAFERPPLLVAHSLGCILAARWLPTMPPGTVAGAFLVAPPDLDRILVDPRYDPLYDRPFDITGFDPVPLAPLPVPSLLVASRNDEYLSFDRAEHFARAWGSAFHDAGALGHINAASGLGDWPQGQALLRRFASGLRPPAV